MNDNLKSNGKDQLEEAAKARVKEFIDSNNIDNVIGVGLVRLAGGGPVFVKVYLSDLCDHNECPTEIDGVKVDWEVVPEHILLRREISKLS